MFKAIPGTSTCRLCCSIAARSPHKLRRSVITTLTSHCRQEPTAPQEFIGLLPFRMADPPTPAISNGNPSLCLAICKVADNFALARL